MNAPMQPRQPSPVEAAALEARFGLRVAARLELGAQSLPHDIEERLRVARLQAVERARLAARKRQPVQAPAAPAVEIIQLDLSSGAVALRGGAPEQEDTWWMRLSVGILLLVLVAGLIGIDRWQSYERIEAVADMDAELLVDDLPPAAYADPGFTEFVAAAPELAAE